MTTLNVTSSTDSQMHNNIMAAGSMYHPPMLAPGRYPQWRSLFLRYVDTRPNDEALRKCILSGPYKPITILVQAVEATNDSLAIPEHTIVETPMNMSPENKAHFLAEKEAIHLILTGIGDEIYSTIDACQIAQEIWEAIERFYKLMNEMIRNNLTVITMQVNVQFLQQLQPEWSRFMTIVKKQHKLDEVSYHKLFDILKQYQNEVNELRAERLVKNANSLALVATAQANEDPYYQTSRSHKSHTSLPKPSISTRSHTTTRHKGKEISKPITPPSETASEKDIYKTTNNNLRTSSNSKNKNVDTTPRFKNDNKSGQFGNQRMLNVDGAREKVGSSVVQQTGIQCFNCREYGHFAKECRMPKRVKDSAYHKEKMLLCKQAEQGVPLQAEQYDWLEDTDEEVDEHELEAHYSYMAKIQEVPTADSGTDFKPVKQVQNDARYNVFANGLQHSEQSAPVSNTCLVEMDDSNVIPDSPDMCEDDIQNGQNDVESNDERTEFEKYTAFNDRTIDYEKLKQHEQYVKIQDSKAQLQDKNIAISELKKLIKKGKGKSVDTKFDKPSVVRQPNAQQIPKPSVLCKLAPFSNSLKRIYFPKTKSVPKANVSEGLSKPVTAQTLPQRAKQAVSNTNVLKSGIYRIDNRSTQTRATQLHQTVRNTNPHVSTSTGVNHKPNVSRPHLKSNQSRDKLMPNNSQGKVKKTQVEVHPRIPSVSNKMKSVTTCKDSLNSRTLNANAVCTNFDNFLVDSNHFACVTKMLNDVNARTKKPTVVPISTRKPKSQANKSVATHHKKKIASKSTNQKPQSYFRKLYETTSLNHNLFSVGQFCDADLEVAFRKSTCFVRDLQGNNLLTGNRGSNLYTISLQESTSSTQLCLMTKASPTQAWLWHQRLSHLNFDYINLLLKKDIVIGLPKLKYVKDQLCYSCELSKEKRSSFKSKAVPSSKGRLNLLHMDLCGPMQVASINGKKYILVFVDDYSRYTWTLFLRSKDETPEVLKEFLKMIQRNLQALVITKASDYDNPDLVPQLQYVSSLADTNVLSQQELDILFGPLYDAFFNAGSNPQDKQPSTNIQSTSKPSTPIYVHAKENNNDQAEKGEHLQDDEFTNPFYHMLEQVRRILSRPVQTIRQLVTDPEMCMFALTVWELIDKPFGKTVIKLKWLWKNKKDEDQTMIRNKARLVAKGYAQEEALYGLKQAPRAWYDELSKFLTSKGFTKGLQIHQSLRGIFINQAKYTLKILHKHGMDKGQSIGTPMATKPKLDADLSENPVDQTNYRNADHARCIDSRKSTYGGIQFLGDKLVSWMSKKLNCTAMSSAEAKYVALSTSCAQVMWTRTQLQYYGFNYNKIPLYCDSQSATEFHVTPYSTAVPSTSILADMFTKVSPEDMFKYLVRRIGMRCLTPVELEVLANESV
nr:integrase, catalytic region, zinc finger, CCHC-type, peptidase aspartic, catalytic [Tanacetum cinerariifolium]